VVEEWLEEVNVDKVDSVTIAGILTQLNLRVAGEYRNRDMLRFGMRIGETK
jgi:hypothetical protein